MEIDNKELKDYIIKRIEALKNKHDWDYGFISEKDIVGGLNEMRLLAKRFKIDVSPVHSFETPNWIKTY